MNKKKPGKIYENLAKMFYDLVKVPLAVLLLQPLLLENLSGAVIFFGASLCLFFLYAAIVLDLEHNKVNPDV